MSDDRGTPGRAKRMGWAVGLLAGGALVGGILATALPAAAQSPSPAPSASASNGTGTGQPPGPGGDHGTGGGPGGAPGGQRPDETVLTGTDAATAKAAALKAVPGATVDRVETDADGAVYEAHLTKADGTKVTVKFDKNFAVTAIQDGMGSHK